MTSKADAILTFKSFGANMLPDAKPEVGVVTLLKKKQGDALFTLAFTDATLKDLRSMKGVVLSAEKKLGGGVKGTLAVTPANKDGLATLNIDKRVGDSDLTLKASYQLKGDIVTVAETWKFDPNNKVTGTYNFAKEELLFAYEHTRGSLKLGGMYSLKTEKALLSAEKRQGKHTVTATFSPKDELASLTWNVKPFKAVMKGKASKDGVKGVTAALMLTKEFEL